MLRLNRRTSARNTIDRGELAAVRVGPHRVRIRKSDLDRWIAESAASMVPTEEQARTEFETAQAAVQGADGNNDLRLALKQLAVASTKLARALPRGQWLGLQLGSEPGAGPRLSRPGDEVLAVVQLDGHPAQGTQDHPRSARVVLGDGVGVGRHERLFA